MATKPGDLCSIPRIQMMEKENQLHNLSSDLHACVHTQYVLIFLKKDSTYETQGRRRITQTHG